MHRNFFDYNNDGQVDFEDIRMSHQIHASSREEAIRLTGSDKYYHGPDKYDDKPDEESDEDIW